MEKLIGEAGFLRLSFYVPNILNARGYKVERPSEEGGGGSTDFELLKRGYLEYLGLVVDHTIKDKVWKQVVKESRNRATLEELLDHISTAAEIDWGDYSGALVEFDVFLGFEPAYFGPLDPYAKTMAVEGIRNIIFGIQIASAVRELPTKEQLVRLGALPSTTTKHHEFTEERESAKRATGRVETSDSPAPTVWNCGDAPFLGSSGRGRIPQNLYASSPFTEVIPGMKGDDYEDFVERATSTGDQTPSRETAEHYFDFLSQRGYVAGDKMHVKVTRKFADILIEAVEDARERPRPIRKDREVAEGLAWNMARIILQRERGSKLLSDMNPEELARVAQLVVGILRTYIKDPSLLSEAIDAPS